MMGDRTKIQEALFYEFRLEDHVPAGHLLRSIDRFVDLDGLREHLRGTILNFVRCGDKLLEEEPLHEH